MKTIFSIQRGYSGREVVAIVSSAERLGASIVWETEPSPLTIPIGPVEFCETNFGPHRKDFYPDFLTAHFCRGILKTKVGQLYARRFVKDATAWKSDFVSELKPSGYILPPGDWWISEPVTFCNEWRYYVADGCLIVTGWYDGTDEDKPAPELPIAWPAGFSGAVDFGELQDGRMALVEAHAPFACGWYGDDHKDYALWQAMAWESSDWWKSPKNNPCHPSQIM